MVRSSTVDNDQLAVGQARDAGKGVIISVVDNGDVRDAAQRHGPEQSGVACHSRV